MGSTAIRPINGGDYLYYIKYHNGTKLQICCGNAYKKESRLKALDLELEELVERSGRIRDREKQIMKMRKTILSP